MKLTGIILLATSAAIGANAQVLKGTASSSNPRLRRNVMKKADRRRLQTSIECIGIIQTPKELATTDGYGKGCVEFNGSPNCAGNNDSFCESNNVGYNDCFIDGTSPTEKCVCIIPNPTAGSQYKCNGHYGTKAEKPCCFEGENCNSGVCQGPTDSPTDSPTKNPTDSPTKNPTDSPTDSPTKNPTDAPTDTPTKTPTEVPSEAPSESSAPSVSAVPSQMPSDTGSPSVSVNPSQAPSVSINPTQIPTGSPVTPSPTDTPTKNPSEAPTDTPTKKPLTDSPVTDAPTADELTDSPVTPVPTKSPVTDKPTVDKKELFLLLLLLKLALLDYVKDLVWSSSAWSSSSSSWSGDSWDKPDTPPTPPSGKAGKSGSTGESGSKAFKGKGGKASSIKASATNAPSSSQVDAPAPPESDEFGDVLPGDMLEMMPIMLEQMTLILQMYTGGILNDTGGLRKLEAVDVNGIKAKFMKRIQTTFNGRRDLEMVLGASVGMMDAFQDILADNKDVFESDDMEAVEAKLESLLN